MAAQQFTLDMTPTKGSIKKDVVISTPLVDPTTNEIWVGFGSTVPTRRGTEITNAINFLASGIRDRNLIDRGAPDFMGASLITAVGIDNVTTSDRRTSGTLAEASVVDDDVVIGMGQTVTGLTYTVMHEAAIEQLIRAVQEWLYKNG